MDEAHLAAALRYVLLNPARARLAARAEDWPWSSVHAHLGTEDGITATVPVAERVENIAALLQEGDADAETWQALRRAESTGRPLGSPAFLRDIETRLGRTVMPQKRGPKPEREEEGAN